jgi:hypothetical protein
MAKKAIKKSKVLVNKKSNKKNSEIRKVSKTPVKKKIITRKSATLKTTVQIPPILNYVDSSKQVITLEQKNKMIAEAAYYIAERYRNNPQLAAWLDAEKEIEILLATNVKL